MGTFSVRDELRRIEKKEELYSWPSSYVGL